MDSVVRFPGGKVAINQVIGFPVSPGFKLGDGSLIKARGLYALFTGEDDTWEALMDVDTSGFSSVISFGGNGIKLRRGYAPSQSPKPTQDELRQQKEEEMDDYCSQVPVRHLVFMVHGIGQRLEKSNLVDDVGTFRQVTASLAERHLTSYQRGTQRVLLIPCQWRKDLKLSGESAVEKITLDGVRGLRVMLSATVHDVLYYMSPIYCQEIIDSGDYDGVVGVGCSHVKPTKRKFSLFTCVSQGFVKVAWCWRVKKVSNQLNRLYLKFLKRNPGYDGKVSLYGHSLGSVLSYDILCHQETLSSPFPMDWMYKEHTNNEKSSPNIGNQTSRCNSTSDLGNKNFSVNNEIEGMVGPIDEGNVGAVEEHAEDSCIPLGPPALSDSDHSAIAVDCDASSLDECTVKPTYDSHGLNESSSLKSDSKQNDEEVSQSDNDRTVKLLREEIEFLNARIKELEAQSGAKGTEQESTAVTTQHVSERLPPGQYDASKSYTPYINYTKLAFKVDTFFAAGSPLGVFLALRNIRIGIGKGQEYWNGENISEEMPACRQMFNIFHPFDPVAYRIEPLICRDYINKPPVIIPYHRGGKRLHIGLKEFAEDFASRSQAIVDQISFVKVKVLTLCQSRNNDRLDEAFENSEKQEERSYGSIMLERLTGSEDGRIDHVLQMKPGKTLGESHRTTYMRISRRFLSSAWIDF
ncbi:hypothetical protein RJ639_047863 [Escallonia herrerae]|uniref:DDHD domain-containing protein n=1 Tax=Escallonia herrerae TaxID=1293975 RepID=A0AA89AZV5_9ASTE|nr:hypothetical protein RJ639_047863 [Escallonia herrerae]